MATWPVANRKNSEFGICKFAVAHTTSFDELQDTDKLRVVHADQMRKTKIYPIYH